MQHASDCAVHNAPAMPAGPCDCGAGIDIEWLGGNCPVQAEGTIDGRRFYFRARHEHWSIEIAATATTEYVKWPEDETTFEYEEEWDGPNAGWMSEDTAREMIAKGAALYRDQITK